MRRGSIRSTLRLSAPLLATGVIGALVVCAIAFLAALLPTTASAGEKPAPARPVTSIEQQVDVVTSQPIAATSQVDPAPTPAVAARQQRECVSVKGDIAATAADLSKAIRFAESAIEQVSTVRVGSPNSTVLYWETASGKQRVAELTALANGRHDVFDPVDCSRTQDLDSLRIVNSVGAMDAYRINRLARQMLADADQASTPEGSIGDSSGH